MWDVLHPDGGESSEFHLKLHNAGEVPLTTAWNNQSQCVNGIGKADYAAPNICHECGTFRKRKSYRFERLWRLGGVGVVNRLRSTAGSPDRRDKKAMGLGSQDLADGR